MERLIQKLEFASANLANVSTAGYKAVHLYTLLTQGGVVPAGTTSTGGTVAGVGVPEYVSQIDFSPGMTQHTDSNLDLMIEGEGFFVVQTKEGIAYTRRGDFTVDRNRRLVTSMGDPVLGAGNRPIVLKEGVVSVSGEGVVAVDGEERGKLRIVSFPDLRKLERGVGGYFRTAGEAQDVTRPKVVQGAIELSNVNAVKEMVDLIDIHRAFETYQKVIQTIDDEEKTATSRVGRLT